MNDVFTLAVFAAKVLCLIVFVSVLKPDGSIGAVQTSTNLADCRIERSGLQERGPNVLRSDFASRRQALHCTSEQRSPLKQ